MIILLNLLVDYIFGGQVFKNTAENFVCCQQELPDSPKFLLLVDKSNILNMMYTIYD